jgi:hypothetical protein
LTATPLEHDAIGLNRVILLSRCLSMIFSENRCPLFRIMLYSAASTRFVSGWTRAAQYLNSGILP